MEGAFSTKERSLEVVRTGGRKKDDLRWIDKICPENRRCGAAPKAEVGFFCAESGGKDGIGIHGRSWM